MRFASALSEHPVTAHAAGEVVGQVMERIPDGVDLAVLWLTAPHAGALEDVAGVVRATLRPGVLVGAAVESVIGTGREVERAAAVALWAGSGFSVGPVRVEGGRVEVPGPELRPAALLLVADPFSVDVPATLWSLRRQRPGMWVTGGATSAARGRGGNRLVLDGRVVSDGMVGCYLGHDAMVRPLVAQGARPVGQLWTVTRAEGNMVYELGGRSALARLGDLAEDGLEPGDIRSINSGRLALGEVLDERRADPGPEDFLVHSVLGADRAAGALALDGPAEVGRILQFHLRDAGGAEWDLRAQAARHRAEAAVAFVSASRGQALYGRRHADAEALAEELGAVPLTGMGCGGEWGPVGGVNRVLSTAASIALFGATGPG